jgi:endonuclease YncB( thermonuclease family)
VRRVAPGCLFAPIPIIVIFLGIVIYHAIDQFSGDDGGQPEPSTEATATTREGGDSGIPTLPGHTGTPRATRTAGTPVARPHTCDEEAIVRRVVDGDTVVVEIDGREERLRYVGIDTPEVTDSEPYSEEAKALNADLVEGKEVCLERDVNDRDSFGRLLRYVWLPDGTFVNEVIVREGLAWVVRFGEDSARLQPDLLPAEHEAIADRRGVWSLVSEKAPSCYEAGENTCNCGDFARRQEAEYFHAVFDLEDVNRLVNTGDGLACVSLPDRLGS